MLLNLIRIEIHDGLTDSLGKFRLARTFEGDRPANQRLEGWLVNLFVLIEVRPSCSPLYFTRKGGASPQFLDYIIMKKALLVFGFLYLMLCAGVTASAGENESLNLRLSLDWKIANHAEQHGYVIIEYVRQGDDIHHWKELFTYQNFGLRGKHAPTPQTELDALKALKEKECPGATEWNVIEQDESSVLYEWQEKPCLGWPDQHEIARIIFGKHNLFILHYAAKVQQLDPDTRKNWIKTFEDATIDPEKR